MLKWYQMNPNQQPINPPDGGQPQPSPVPPQQPSYSPPVEQPQVAPQPTQQPQGFGQQSFQQAAQPPQPPSSYQAPESPQPYDPGYLDSIAPPPPKQAFFSGSFGKIFFIMLGLFVLAVSFIVAFSGQDKTADLQQVSVRLDNFTQLVKDQQKNLRSNNLTNINTDFSAWLSGNFGESETLLQEGGVKKTQYDKQMVAAEEARVAELEEKYEDARLNAILNRVYANSMASETEQIMNMLNTMAKKSQSAKIREYAKDASDNLQPIQERFEKYNDDGSN
jgi:hypothetical protein